MPLSIRPKENPSKLREQDYLFSIPTRFRLPMASLRLHSHQRGLKYRLIVQRFPILLPRCVDYLRAQPHRRIQIAIGVNIGISEKHSLIRKHPIYRFSGKNEQRYMLIPSIIIEILMLAFAVYVSFKRKNTTGEYAIAFLVHELVKFSLLLLPFVQESVHAPASIIFLWIGIPMIIGLVHSYKTKRMIGRYLFVLLLIFLMFGASPIWRWLPFSYLVYRFLRDKQETN